MDTSGSFEPWFYHALPMCNLNWTLLAASSTALRPTQPIQCLQPAHHTPVLLHPPSRPRVGQRLKSYSFPVDKAARDGEWVGAAEVIFVGFGGFFKKQENQHQPTWTNLNQLVLYVCMLFGASFLTFFWGEVSLEEYYCALMRVACLQGRNWECEGICKLWETNIAIEQVSFIDDVPIKNVDVV